ncbi:MAG: pyruvate/2-oxoglutarate dehydrogenase complex dihydrolipoamide dehydrogenase (E3) component [Myxococcota bacterium]|jgi:pyruvate/2-oxoglutarate dehydrogenase complex dihydrolipoamide dehydrogenase (E3) component
MSSFDLAVIGGGSAGLTAATIAGSLGARVVLIDKQRLGGDCLWTGCVPSKAFIHCARLAHQSQDLERYGLGSGAVEPDFARVMDYVHSVMATIAEHDSPNVMSEHGVETRFGGATYESPTHIRVGGANPEVIEAKRSIIAVGSHAASPPITGLADVDPLTNESVFQLKELPRRLAVIGGGPIGVELGQAFARLGSRVTILQRGASILDKDDPELTAILAEQLRLELDLRVGSSVGGVGVADGAQYVDFTDSEGEHRLEVDRILVAVGRRSNAGSLGLEAAGVETNRDYVVVDDYLKTSASNIWAAGDCTGGPQFTHSAEAQARIAARNALFVGRSKYGTNIPWTTFADPELAHVGLTEAAARAQDPTVHVYRYPLDRLDRALCEGNTRGLAKLVATASGEILGASILAPHAGEMLPSIVLAMDQGVSVKELGNTVFAYPTHGRMVRRLTDERFLEHGVSGLTKTLFGRF